MVDFKQVLFALDTHTQQSRDIKTHITWTIYVRVLPVRDPYDAHDIEQLGWLPVQVGFR